MGATARKCVALLAIWQRQTVKTAWVIGAGVIAWKSKPPRFRQKPTRSS
jgi:hypothetical protein